MIADMIEALQFSFMRHALLAGMLVSIACGIIGTYVVVNRIVFISGGIAHAAYGGIGLGYYLKHDTRCCWGADRSFSAWLSALLGASVQLLARSWADTARTRQRADTIIGVHVGHRHGPGHHLRRPHPGLQGRSDELPVWQHPGRARSELIIIARPGRGDRRPGRPLLQGAAGHLVRRDLCHGWRTCPWTPSIWCCSA